MLVNKTYMEKMNALASRGTPFLFIIDYEGRQPLIYPLDQLPDSVAFTLPGLNSDPPPAYPGKLQWEIEPVGLETYRRRFSLVMEEIIHGNTFLLNLTQPTRVRTNLSLRDIYRHSRARYKLLVDEQFVVFSPETFVRISGDQISTYPMKGTADASLPDAEENILRDEKETAEHYTIVDLMRNDLSRIARDVEVSRFRYIDRIQTRHKDMLQVSSEIRGRLYPNYRERLGDLLFSLLPAGSISGAPKAKTLEIISASEGYRRGYYTGVFGVFDGQHLDSAVMIRYLDMTEEGLVYKSGGGITHRSTAEKEYQELIDKVYVSFT